MNIDLLKETFKNAFENRLHNFSWGFTYHANNMSLEIADGLFKGIVTFEIHGDYTRLKSKNRTLEVLGGVEYTHYPLNQIADIAETMIYNAQRNLVQNPTPFIMRPTRAQSSLRP